MVISGSAGGKGTFSSTIASPLKLIVSGMQQAKYFKTLLSEAGRLPKVKNLKIKRDDVSIYKDAFEVR